MEEKLKLLGLTDNEIKVYIAILKECKCTGTKLRQKTGIANSRVYAALDTLLQKGIITYEKRQKGKIYSALEPEVIKEFMQERMKKIEEVIPYLKTLQQKEKETTETAVFEGFQGFKSALYKMVNECPKGGTIDILGFSNQAYKNEKLAALLRDVNKVSKVKKHKFRMILDNKKNEFFEQRKKEDLGQIRFMEKGFRSPAAIDIFQDYVFILLWEETPYAFVIRNKNIAEGFKIYFNFLWNMAKA
jgi:sugar-specific transcriptional regulator TrmB